MRANVVYAVTWRILAELLRRHHAREDLRLYWLFPGISQTGMVLLRRPDGEVVLELDVAHAHVGKPTVGDARTRQYVDALLSATDPKAIVDSLGVGAGLPRVEGPLPESSPTVLCARAIAGVLERNMLARKPLRTTPGYFDQNGHVGAFDWAVQIAGVAEQLARARAAAANVDESSFVQHIFALHRGDAVLGLPAKTPFVAFDFRRGMAHAAPHGGVPRSTLALDDAYQASGRRLGPLVDWTEMWL